MRKIVVDEKASSGKDAVIVIIFIMMYYRIEILTPKKG